MNKTRNVSPAISVLLSGYNGARWLDEAINSVLSQTLGDFEFIIVDDGSTDNSPEIIKRYAAQDARIVVIAKNNTGLADSLNVGIQRARCEWIARLDADDICEPARLEKQLAKARVNPGLVFIGSGLLEIDENGNALKTYRYPDRHALLTRNLYTARKFPAHSSAFYRTDVVRTIGGYRPRIKRAEDWDLWLRLSEVGQFAAIDEPLVRLRKHSDQISHDESGRRQIIDARVAIACYWLRYHGFHDPIAADDGVFQSFYAWVENRLEQEGTFEFYDYIARVKTSVAEMNKSPSALLVATRHIIGEPGFLLRFLRVRLIGDMTLRRLALEWMRVTDKCAVSKLNTDIHHARNEKALVIGIDGGNIRGGGTVTHLVETLRVADPGKHGIERVVLWGGEKLLAAIDDKSWLVKRCPAALDRGFVKRTLWQLFSLSKEAKAEECDILFVPGGAYAGSFRPVVVMSQNLLPFDLKEMRRYRLSRNLLRLWLLRLIQSRALKRAEGTIFLTKFARETVLRTTASHRGETSIIAHGLGTRFRMAPKPQRPIIEYTSDKPYRLLYVSTIDEYKHQWHVVEAVAALRQQGYPLALDLVGSAYAPSLLRLKAMISRLDPNNDWVCYHGAVPYAELHQRYAQADLGIFASSCENMPIILLETMGMGLPISCSHRGAMPEVLGDAGVYFDPENPEDIAQAVRTLIDSAELRSEKAAASFKAAQVFSWEKCATETFGFLAAVAGRFRRA